MNFTQNDMEGLFTQAYDVAIDEHFGAPYSWLSNLWPSEQTPSESMGEPADTKCASFHACLENSILGSNAALYAQLDNYHDLPCPHQVWNHAVYAYDSSFEQAPNTSDESVLRVTTNIYANIDFGPDGSALIPDPVNDSTTLPNPTNGECRKETFVYIIKYGSDGNIPLEYNIDWPQNWISCTHYVPARLIRLQSVIAETDPENGYVSSYTNNPEVTIQRVRQIQDGTAGQP